MPAHRKWSDEQQAEVMAIYHEHGPAEASRRTGIPEGTISSIAHRNGNATLALSHTREATVASQARNAQRRETVRELLLEKGEYALRRIDDDQTPHGCQALATVAAIVVDKHLLMSGEATSRHETQGSDLDRYIREQLEKQRRRVTGARSDGGQIIDPDAIEAESSATG